MIKLKKGERLVYAGEAAIRAPNGTPLPAVPQYVIRAAADSSGQSAPLKKTERLILAGHELPEKKRAEERYDALKAGQKCLPREAGGIPLYIVSGAGGFNSAGFAPEDEKINAALAAELAAHFSLHMGEREATGQVQSFT